MPGRHDQQEWEGDERARSSRAVPLVVVAVLVVLVGLLARTSDPAEGPAPLAVEEADETAEPVAAVEQGDAAGLNGRSPAAADGSVFQTPPGNALAIPAASSSIPQSLPLPPDAAAPDGTVAGWWHIVEPPADLRVGTSVVRRDDLLVGFAPDVWAFEPAEGSWVEQAPHPADPVAVGAAVWTGNEVLVVGSQATADAPVLGTLHALVGSDWVELEPIPPWQAEPGAVETLPRPIDLLDVAWDGERLLVALRAADGSLQLGSFSGNDLRWRQIVGPSIADVRELELVPMTEPYSGDRSIVLLGRGGDEATAAPAFTGVLSADATAWDRRDSSPELGRGDLVAVAAADQIIVMTGPSTTAEDTPPGAVLQMGPDGGPGRWTALPAPAPSPGGAIFEGPPSPGLLELTWDGRFAVLTGAGPLQLWEPDAGRWVYGDGPSPRGVGRVHRVGAELLAWAATEERSSAPDLQRWQPVRPLARTDVGWFDIATPAGARGVGSAPAVWTARELLVGFSPEVWVHNPVRRPENAWRQIAPNPSGAVEVLGAEQVSGTSVFVFGSRTCDTCSWAPTLHALDIADETWTERAPLPLDDDDLFLVTEIKVAQAGGQLLVLRRHPDRRAYDLWGYDPASEEWRNLGMPRTPGGRATLVGAGDLAVVMAEDDSEGWVLRLDLRTREWERLDAPVINDPGGAEAVWAGDLLIVWGGSGGRWEGERPRRGGAVLDLVTGTWDPFGEPDPRIAGIDVTEMSSEFDGRSAIFMGSAGGIPVAYAYSIERDGWVDLPTPLTHGRATLHWTHLGLLRWRSQVDGVQTPLQRWPGLVLTG